MDFHYLIPLFAAIIYVSLFFFIIFNRPWQEQHRLFSLYLVAATLWSFSDFLMRSPALLEYKIILFRIVIFFTLWWALQLYYFARSFLHLRGGWGIWFGYVSLVVFGILVSAGNAPAGVKFSGGVISPVYGWWLIFYVVPVSVLGVMGVYSLIKRLRVSTGPMERNKIAYFIFAVILLAVFGFFGITPWAKGYPITHVGALLSACIFTYAVMRHELISINSILRRGLGWASLFVLGCAAYLFIFFLLNLLFNFELRFITLVIATLSAAAVAIFIYWLRPIFLGVLDQLFYRGTYPYRQALLSFSSKMGNIINLKELADEMLPSVVETLRIPYAKLLFEDESSSDFVTQFTFPKVEIKPNDELRFSLDSSIITWLEKETAPLDLRRIDLIPQLKGLWQAEKDRLAASDARFLCPIKSRGNLVGILALGRKESNARYSQDDIELITSLANEAGILIENARMFDSLTKQQLQVERLLAELVHAQEEERQRISIELHDSVAQWLAGASYRAQTVDALISGNGNQQAREELATMENTIAKSLRELRRVLVGLRPPVLDELGLSQALQQSLEDLKVDGLSHRFIEIGVSRRLPSSVEIAVYRIVQEAINNIRKHASATKVDIRLQFQSTKLVIEIRDNGCGFDLSETMASAVSVGHMGLLGMKQRVEMLAGNFKIKTDVGRGTTITLSLPVQSEEEEK